MAVICKFDAIGISKAVQLLKQGGIVAFATETVYGLGGDATNDQAIAEIYKVKGRPAFNPLIIHISNLDMLAPIIDVSQSAKRIMAQGWPGSLTLVLPLKEDTPISNLVTAGLTSIAVRMPAHQGARDLIRAFGKPIAAPSANPSGRLSPTRAAHVVAGLGEQLPLILDGGDCEAGLESTIIDLTDHTAPCLLRAGTYPVSQFETLLGVKIPPPLLDLKNAECNSFKSPGQMLRHYAPATPLRLNAEAPNVGEAWLGFGKDHNHDAILSENLSPQGKLIEAAANLFHYLHKLDQPQQVSSIAVAPIIAKTDDPTDQILALAINDRLTRASN